MRRHGVWAGVVCGGLFGGVGEGFSLRRGERGTGQAETEERGLMAGLRVLRRFPTIRA